MLCALIRHSLGCKRGGPFWHCVGNGAGMSSKRKLSQRSVADLFPRKDRKEESQCEVSVTAQRCEWKASIGIRSAMALQCSFRRSQQVRQREIERERERGKERAEDMEQKTRTQTEKKEPERAQRTSKQAQRRHEASHARARAGQTLTPEKERRMRW